MADVYVPDLGVLDDLAEVDAPPSWIACTVAHRRLAQAVVNMMDNITVHMASGSYDPTHVQVGLDKVCEAAAYMKDILEHSQDELEACGNHG